MAQAAAPNLQETQRLAALREGQVRDRRMQQKRSILGLVRGGLLMATMAGTGAAEARETGSPQAQTEAQADDQFRAQQLIMQQEPSAVDRVTQAFLSIWQNLQNIQSRTLAQIEKTTKLETLKTLREKTDKQLDKLKRNAGKIKVKKESKAVSDNFFKGFTQTHGDIAKAFRKKEILLREIKQRDERNDLLSKELFANPLTAIPWFNLQLIRGYMMKKGKDKIISSPSWRFLHADYLLPDVTARGAIILVDGLIAFALFLQLVQLLFLIILIYAAFHPLVMAELALGLLGPVSNFLYGILAGL